MNNELLAKIAALQTMPFSNLKKLWREMYETDLPGLNRKWIVDRLAYRIQELALEKDIGTLEQRLSGGNTNRPGLKRLLTDIEARRIDIVVVYKIDRLTRSLMDFAKLIEVFDRHNVSFVSVTQQFNTTTPMGRLILNVLLSFAQFEREQTGERIRDKVAASKKKGMWMGGCSIASAALARR